LQKVPKNWKKADIIPIFKKGKKEEIDSHGPVSLTLIPEKVIEQLILVTLSKTTKEMMTARS